MQSLEPLRRKYWPAYMGMAKLAAQQSVARRHKVGAAVITPSGMISIGWNGTPSGMPNHCEEMAYVPEEGTRRLKTLPWVVHAEANALSKMLAEGVSPKGATLFVTRAPCLKCAIQIHTAGITTVVFNECHDDPDGMAYLEAVGIVVTQYFLPQAYLLEK